MKITPTPPSPVEGERYREGVRVANRELPHPGRKSTGLWKSLLIGMLISIVSLQ